MAGSPFVAPEQGGDLWATIQQLVQDANGSTSWQRTKNWTGMDDDDQYVATITNQGDGGHLLVSNELSVASDGTGTAIRLLNVTGAMTVASIHVTGNALIDGTLGAGASTLASVHVTGNSTLDGTLGAGASTLASLSVTGAAAVLGNTALGNADADTITVIGASTFKNAAAAVQLFISAADAKVIVGSATALGTAANDLFSVIGGTSYFVGASGASIGIRYVSTDTVGWLIGKNGAGANKDLIFLDDASTLVATIHDTSFANYAMTLENGIHVKGPGDFDGAMSLGNAAGDAIDVRGTTTLFAPLSSGALIGINIGGSSVFGSGITITTGGLTVTAGGVTITAGGVIFPATEAPSADANTLDDYEEGSWTPANGSTSYTTQTGSYVKIGRQVTVWGLLTINVIGAGSASTISGLPFTADIAAAGMVSSWGGLSSNVVQIGCQTNGATVFLTGTTAAAANSATLSVLQSGSSVRFSVSYTTAN